MHDSEESFDDSVVRLVLQLGLVLLTVVQQVFKHLLEERDSEHCVVQI